jgi:hypothetical protein
MVSQEHDLTLFPVVSDVSPLFNRGSGLKFKYVLLCRRAVWLNVGWKAFPFPFEGCHDFCPFMRSGYDKMYDCEIFKAETDRRDRWAQGHDCMARAWAHYERACARGDRRTSDRFRRLSRMVKGFERSNVSLGSPVSTS